MLSRCFYTDRCSSDTVRRCTGSVLRRSVPCEVLAERGVDVPSQPVDGLPCGLYFHAEAVALAGVAGYHLAYLVNFSRQHEQVLIVHVVEVCPGAEPAAEVLVAGIPVRELLGLQFCADVVLVVVACRLLVDYGNGGVDLVIRRFTVATNAPEPFGLNPKTADTSSATHP